MFKKTVTLLSILSCFAVAKSQTTVTAETLEGTVDMNDISLMNHSFMGTIGMNPYVPNAPLQNSWWSMINIRHRNGGADGNAWGTQIAVGMTAYNDRMFFRGHYNSIWQGWQEVYTAATPRVRINNATDDGVTALQINGNTSATTFSARNTVSVYGSRLYDMSNSAGVVRFSLGFFTQETGGNAGSDFGIFSYTDVGGFMYTPFVIKRVNGNVGICTANPQERLSVDGTILTKKVKVSTAAASWPDFVFHQGYSLMPLAALEKFIAQHQHLPEIPSAADIAKDGQDLGEMNRKLLQKVEELTLYIISQQKQLEDQQRTQQAQQAEINRLRESVEKK